MAIYKSFDINTAATAKPWGPREEQAIKDIIDTLVVDTIDATKNVSGHLHGKIYASDSVAAIDASTSTSLTLNLRDDIATGLLIKNRNGDSIITVDSTIAAPKVAFNCILDINDNIDLGVNYLNYDGSDSAGLSFNVSNQPVLNDNIVAGAYYLNYDGSDSAGISFDALNNVLCQGNFEVNGVSTFNSAGTNDNAHFISTDANCQIYFSDSASTSTSHVGIGASGDHLRFFSGGLINMQMLSTGQVGIGTTGPDALLHVFAGDSTTTAPHIAGDDFVIENSENCGMSILSPDANSSLIYFGSPSDNVGAAIQWTYGTAGADLEFRISTSVTGAGMLFRSGNNVDAMYIDSSQNVGIGTTGPLGRLDVQESGIGIMIGANSGSTGRTNGAGKFGAIGCVQTDNSEEGVCMAATYTDVNNNYVRIGGGSSNLNAATNVLFYTAANNVTLTGTERMRIASDGGLYMAGATGGSQGAGTINATAVYDDGAGPLTDYVFEKHYDENYSISEDNEPAQSFEGRYEICKTIDTFLSYIKENKCFPAFNNGGKKLSIGDSFQKLLETVETLVYHLDSMNTRLKALNV